MALLDIPPDRRTEGGGEVGMTREEAIMWLKMESSKPIKWDDYSEESKRIREDAERHIAKAFDMAIDALKSQEPRMMELNELAFYDSGLYVETRNGCPEGLIWSALCHLYCVSQNGKCGYVSFVTWNADTYDFEAKDYNVEFRCWTSRPDEKRRAETPWQQ